jgi:hypothetical protein
MTRLLSLPELRSRYGTIFLLRELATMERDDAKGCKERLEMIEARDHLELLNLINVVLEKVRDSQLLKVAA